MIVIASIASIIAFPFLFANNFKSLDRLLCLFYLIGSRSSRFKCSVLQDRALGAWGLGGS
jgi:hypothetical protein